MNNTIASSVLFQALDPYTHNYGKPF